LLSEKQITTKTKRRIDATLETIPIETQQLGGDKARKICKQSVHWCDSSAKIINIHQQKTKYNASCKWYGCNNKSFQYF